MTDDRIVTAAPVEEEAQYEAGLRPRVLDALRPDSPPHAYLGANILPLKQVGGGPVDRLWQVPKLEYWLKKQGVRDNPRPEPLPKQQPKSAPKSNRR